MQTLHYALKRLEMFLEELERLRESEFPYADAQDALQYLHEIVSTHLSELKQLSPNSDEQIIKHRCALASQMLFNYLPLAGFILRSTNIRNAFEVHGPLLRLAGAVLEPGVSKRDLRTRLLLSSEWDYSPFILLYPDFPNFVLIGLPSPESANPLLLPLAGHELGHLVWEKKLQLNELKSKVTQAIVKVITHRWSEYINLYPSLGNIKPKELSSNLYAIDTWKEASVWTLRQAEETFCDFIGLRVFGIAYLHAFAYLLSPNVLGERGTCYPNFRERAENLLKAATAFSLSPGKIYSTLFEDLECPTLSDSQQFMLSVSDDALKELVNDLIKQSDEIVSAAGVPKSTEAEVKRIQDRHSLLVPAENVRCLPDILNAGWRASRNGNLWKESSDTEDAHDVRSKDRILKELVLKNIEVFEIEQIVRE